MLHFEKMKSICIGIGETERRSRPNKSDAIRYHGKVMADHLPADIPFYIDDYGEKIRLCFPTKEARQAADEYGVRGFLKDAIKEAQA